MGYDFNFNTPGYVVSYDFNFRAPYNSYYILAGASNNFTSIWADANTGLTSGKLYIASNTGFSIVDLSNNILYDAYTQTIKGRGNETLSSNDIVDINVA